MATVVRSVVLIICSFCVHFMSWGMTMSMGVLYIELLENFGGSKSATAAVSSIFAGVILLVGPVSGSAMAKFGCRVVGIVGSATLTVGLLTSVFAPSLGVLYFTFGIVGGVGASFMHTSGHVNILENFSRRRSMASCISGSGSSVGSFVIPLLTEVLLDKYGYRGTLLLLAGLGLQCVVAASLFLPGNDYKSERDNAWTGKTNTEDVTELLVLNASEHQEKDQRAATAEIPTGLPPCQDECGEIRATESNTHRNKILIRIRKYFTGYKFVNLTFVMYALAQGILNIGTSVAYLFLADVTRSRGFGEPESVLVQSFLGIGSIVCRVGFGFLGDIKRFDTLYLVIIPQMVLGALFMLTNVIYSYEAMLVVSCVMGFAAGFPTGLNSVVMVELVGIQNASLGVGLMFFIAFIPTMVGTPVAGLITDMTGRYDMAFYYGGLVVFLAALMDIGVLTRKKRTSQH